jgi:hypothetical protein
VATVTRDDRDDEHQQVDRAHHMGRQHVLEWKAEPGQARGGGGRKKEQGSAIEPLRRDQTGHDDKSGDDPRKAQHDVHDRECRHTNIPICPNQAA